MSTERALIREMLAEKIRKVSATITALEGLLEQEKAKLKILHDTILNPIELEAVYLSHLADRKKESEE
jgi:hypothetical protein